MGKPDWMEGMRRFQAYCKQYGKLYAYDGISNIILCLENGMWSIVTVLPPEMGGQVFTIISIYGDILYLYGWKAKYIVRNDLRNKSTEAIKLHDDWRDEKGFFFSNLLVNGDEIILLPFRKSQVRAFDFLRNEVSKDWQMNFAESLKRLRRDCGMIQIRAWGASIIEGSIFMIFTNFKQDKLAIYHIEEQRLELVSVGKYENMFHLDYATDGLYIQGTYQSDFQIAKIDFGGAVLRSIGIKTAVNGLHMQWLHSGRCILLEEDRLIVIDAEFKAKEILLVSNEGEKLEYVSDGLFTDSKDRVYYFEPENNRFCRFQEKSNASEMLLASAEYRQKMTLAMTKRLESGSIGEAGMGIELKTFMEMVPNHLKKAEKKSNIGESIWNILIR